MSWFNRHLNISLVSAWVIVNVLVLFAGIVAPEDMSMSVGSVTLYALAAGLLISTQVWYLRQKARTLWNLLWNLLWVVGLIFLLDLENNRAKQT